MSFKKSLFLTFLAVIMAVLVGIGCGKERSSNFEIKEVEIQDKESKIETVHPNSDIAVVTHYTKNLNYTDLTFGNHTSYIKLHNYAYYRRNGNISGQRFKSPYHIKIHVRDGIYWQKIQAVLDALDVLKADGSRQHTWVMWVDADIIFTNPYIKIEEKISEIEKQYGAGKEFIIATDIQPEWFKVNSGVFLVKNTEYGRSIINQIAERHDQYKENGTPEQEAFQDFIFNKPWKPTRRNDFDTFDVKDIDPRIAYVHQRSINSFEGDFETPIYQDVWQPCDFISHPCGAKNKRDFIGKRLALMDPDQCSQKASQTFSNIYKKGIWGVDENGNGTSGAGSLPEESLPFSKFVNKFVADKKISAITEIGCGDGQVLRQLDLEGKKYICFELVDHLVSNLQKEWAGDANKTFVAKSGLDLVPSDLPLQKEVVIIKDVLMHLSNEQIFKILKNVKEFKYVITVNDIDVSEKNSLNNFNIQTGQFRPLSLTSYPFNLHIAEKFRFNAHGTVKELIVFKPESR